MNEPNRFRFRAWDNHPNFRCFHYSCIGEENNFHFIRVVESGVKAQQSTGLADVNGKEIFEGDVVAIGDQKGALGVVTWNDDHDPCWMLKMGPRAGSWNFGERAKQDYVIGNIYENPELVPCAK